MVHDATFLFALGSIGTEAVSALVVGVLLLGLLGLRRPAAALRRLVRGYELWIAASLALTGTGVSLFFTGFASFYPGEVGWYTRICMYPLSVTTLLAALAADRRAARYLLAFPLAGIGLAVYGILLEDGVVRQSQSCLLSGPGGCTTKWIDEFGYMTISVMSLSTFFLILVALVLAAAGGESGVPLLRLPLRLPITALALTVGLAAAAAVAVAAATSGSPAGLTAGTMARAGVATRAPAAGRALFLSSGCTTCHTLAAAGAHGTIATDLDSVKLAPAVVAAIVANGFTTRGGAEMSPFASSLSPRQIAAVAAFVSRSEQA